MRFIKHFDKVETIINRRSKTAAAETALRTLTTKKKTWLRQLKPSVPDHNGTKKNDGIKSRRSSMLFPNGFPNTQKTQNNKQALLSPHTKPEVIRVQEIKIKINNRYIIHEYKKHYETSTEKYTDIIDTSKNLLISLDPKSITIRNIDEALIEENTKNINISDITFKTVTEHTISIIEDKSIAITTNRKAHYLEDILKQIL